MPWPQPGPAAAIARERAGGRPQGARRSATRGPACSSPQQGLTIPWTGDRVPAGAPSVVLAERRVSGFIQNRLGPNRVGPQGLFQPLADVLKLLFKEEIYPARADKVLYALGPFLAFAPVAIAYAAIPVGRGLQIADINVAKGSRLDGGSLMV